jgi:hypothetical protein
MADGELEELAADSGLLSDAAREALEFEISRRGSEIVVPSPAPAAIPAATLADQEPPGPVILRRFRDLPDALLAKSILDSASIESFLADENTIRMSWFWSNLLGGIKLWVRPEDADAVDLLDQDWLGTFDVEGVGEYTQPRCPNCQSFDISFRGLMKRLAYGSLWFSFPIPVRHVAWKCRSCGHSWEDASN